MDIPQKDHINILEINDLHYTYGNGKVALNGLSLTIKEGEKIAVIGPNGSGKSTFFLNLNGVFFPEKGEIKYRDIPMNKKTLKSFRKNIGIVFQDADNQIIASTVKAEIGFGPMNLKLPKEEVDRRIEDALKYLNLTDFKDRPPHYLSGGEKKRVTIAGTIAMHPEIIIFDEPTVALDPVNASMLEDVLEKLSQDGKTLMISTHDVDFVYRWAERVIVFADGKIVADGSPLEIFKDKSLLKQANLTEPCLLEVYESLVSAKLLESGSDYPKSVDAFKKLLKSL